jgi:hypothetical protein
MNSIFKLICPGPRPPRQCTLRLAGTAPVDIPRTMRCALLLPLSCLLLLGLSRGATSDALPAADAAAAQQFFSISLQVDPRKEECLHLDVPLGAAVEALVMVYRGGKLDVNFRVSAPSGAEVYNQLLFSNLDAAGKELPTIVKKGPSFRAGEGGVYSFCFDNKMAKWTAKVLTFEVTVRDAGEEAAGGGAGAEPAAAVVKAPAGGAGGLVPQDALTTQAGTERSALQHLGSLRKFSDHFLRLLTLLEQDLQYHRLRSARHHDTLLSTEWRVSAWSSAETTTVLLCAALQVLLVRRWFAGVGEGGEGAGHSGGSLSARSGSLLGGGFSSTPRKGV